MARCLSPFRASLLLSYFPPSTFQSARLKIELNIVLPSLLWHFTRALTCGVSDCKFVRIYYKLRAHVHMTLFSFSKRDVLTARNIKNVVFRNVMPCSLVYTYTNVSEKYVASLFRAYAKNVGSTFLRNVGTPCLLTRLHGDATQNTLIFNFLKFA